MAVVEVRCPRCGSPCSSGDRSKGEYHCDHCGAVFHFVDSRESTVVHDTRLHNCPLCGRPVKIEEGFICTQCGKEYVCPKCVQEVAGKFVCKECLKKKWFIVGPSQTCPSCNGSLTYVPQYNRWYCNNCRQYVQHICTRCGGNSRFVPKYNSWYCDTCRDYLRAKETHVENLRPSISTPVPQPIVIQTQPPKSGCFIATAAYGTPMATEIDALRQFRDEELERNRVGRRLVEVYYRSSPPIADVIAHSKKMRALVRLNLKAIVCALKRKYQRARPK
jgi:predicted RNA-binding Zn-ribbon protein involved in translation (DUF1610 family)